MDPLQQTIRSRLLRTAPAAVTALAGEMCRQYGAAVQGVVFYGSCLRQGDALEGVVDLYVIVSDYAHAYSRRRSRILARVLPPTVGYLELDLDDGQTVRAKYAVISLADFCRGTSDKWFLPYLWGRFSQPCLLAYAADEEAAEAIADCLASAARTLVARALPLLPARGDAVGIWSRALDLSYGTELRPESQRRASELVAADEDFYTDLLASIEPDLPRIRRLEEGGYAVVASRLQRAAAAASWRTRRAAGKLLSVARWFKALATFEGGLDYAAWKLERHSGVKVHVSDKMRRRPWLHVWGELIRLYRRGVLR